MSTGTVPSIHRALGFLFLGLGLIMFFLAGLGTFGESFDPHRIVGSLLTLTSLILLILAAIGRREALIPSAALFGLMIVQTVLAVAGSEGASVIGALHPVNGLLILFVAHQVARGLPLPIGARGGRGPSVTA
jgi:hypothetical protein